MCQVSGNEDGELKPKSYLACKFGSGSALLYILNINSMYADFNVTNKEGVELKSCRAYLEGVEHKF